jgi:hypothetical protein
MSVGRIRRGWRHGEYEDLAEAMIAEAAAYIPELMRTAASKERNDDIAEAKRLLAKHGLLTGA